MDKVGVIGAGVMGIGVAQNLAQSGFYVKLVDLNEEILEKAKREIYDHVRFHQFYSQDKESFDPSEVLSRIETDVDLEVVSDCEFIVENATEKWDVKEKIYPRLDNICSESAIFAVNTSCISITKIGALTNRPDRILGIHFMNPVPLKPTVEAIRGVYTSDETIEQAGSILSRMGKKYILVNDMPGFVSNRVLMLTINEAIWLVQDQVAKPEDVDAIFKECFGHASGPLETGDLIGLDTILYSLEVLYESYQDPKFRACPLLRQMVAAGKNGRKSGQGFYTYYSHNS
ncbi:3-hydroxybutyryl-CoA dehydrogenase [Paenibacillus sp. HJL G12]|uniref:3-hydroxybutyryl-CoA dehydrogenase n=1 Tax=Paenibacillus dendrobii TaxID=2691084 RepID=A0A7X3IL50_9BACL|nr:3-hydroxyacyl-CoA dehydrogenase family protein [Paenibacillus dendrobii]MWV44655.1 3-hydroxybutyryl-CoA dehydrogenase [Paenibacillus dendrobii]